MKSRGMTRDQIEARLAVQLPEQELIQRSTYILDNSGTVKELRAEVQELWEEIIRTFQDR
jgi:dephospho-CoA kinase